MFTPIFVKPLMWLTINIFLSKRSLFSFHNQSHGPPSTYQVVPAEFLFTVTDPVSSFLPLVFRKALYMAS